MSVERDLWEERVGRLDLSPYLTAQRGDPAVDVLRRMRDEGRNCVLVVDDGGRLAGIFTERDVLHKLGTVPANLERPVEALMTPSPDTVTPHDRLATALHRMNAGHYRNVPVVDPEGRVVGNLAHYAIVRFLSDRLQDKIYNLPPDPDLVPRAPEGA
jgi:CBS domain-containing protein